jgi:hypothetical protein
VRNRWIGGRVWIIALLMLSVAVTWRTGLVEAQNGGLSTPVAPPSGSLTAAWWQWVIAIPPVLNPILDGANSTCAQGQSGPVWYLGGTFTNDPANRVCTVPQGKQILIPILAVLDGAAAFDCEPTVPGVPCDVPTLRALAAAQENDPALLLATLDGVPIPNLAAYRVISPVFPVTIPADGGALGLPPGAYSPQVSDGYWLLIDPLPAGPHALHVHGIANPNAPFGQNNSDVTYQLTVQCVSTFIRTCGPSVTLTPQITSTPTANPTNSPTATRTPTATLIPTTTPTPTCASSFLRRC